MPHIPKAVLVAVDFGEASGNAVAVGGLIAEKCGAALQLLHAEALEAPAYFTSEQIDQLEKQRQKLRTQAEQYLSRFGGRHTHHPFTGVIANPPPADAIVHRAASADLVVMGTHGRHGPRRWWLGSVAERVLREVSRPLLITRAATPHPVETMFDRALVHAAAPLGGGTSMEVARQFGAVFGGETIDGRHDLIEPAINRTRATVLIVATPQPRTPGWLADYGEPLVRFCPVPILFVPESAGGVLS